MILLYGLSNPHSSPSLGLMVGEVVDDDLVMKNRPFSSHWARSGLP